MCGNLVAGVRERTSGDWALASRSEIVNPFPEEEGGSAENDAPSLRSFQAAPVFGYRRLMGHDPLELKGPFPNETTRLFGLSLSVTLDLGNGNGRTELPRGDFLRWFFNSGELGAFFFVGTSEDRFNAGDLPIDPAVRDLLGDFESRREATTYGGFAEWRRFILPGLDVSDSWRLFHMYFGLGMGILHTRTAVTSSEGSRNVSAWSLVGCASLGMTAFRLGIGGWFVEPRGEVSLCVGVQTAAGGDWRLVLGRELP